MEPRYVWEVGQEVEYEVAHGAIGFEPRYRWDSADYFECGGSSDRYERAVVHEVNKEDSMIIFELSSGYMSVFPIEGHPFFITHQWNLPGFFRPVVCEAEKQNTGCSCDYLIIRDFGCPSARGERCPGRKWENY